MTNLKLDPDAVLADLDELANQSGGRFAGAKRLAWSADWLAARAWLRDKLEAIGLPVSQDVAGNIWATLQGDADAFLIVGSHIDAVPDGGWLDGVLGLMTALETVRQLAAQPAPPPVSVRFVDWADEEGARFSRSLLGSSACAGTLVPDDVRGLRDSGDVSLEDALANCGVDLDQAPQASASLDGAIAYLELHIEQGPVLLDSGRLAAAVSGTVGVERHLITFTGQAAHAGSTPMNVRRDTLAAAAQAALAVRASAITHGGVGTVGNLASTPGVITAVAGRTEMQLDQRHLDPDALAAMLADALAACRAAADEFRCELEVQRVFAATPTPFHAQLVAAARMAVADAGGGDGDPIPSGPMHDATEIGRVVPTAMIFAQSDPPLSHAAIENSTDAALRVAIDAYGRTVSWALTNHTALRGGQIT
ncbi:MAG: hydantoinase/carbamoylase family amidase [Acidobacteriota bacterium]|nr:hydantoinase/carbamoylase family amidase [Acidobacteriota bacterium]